MIRCLALFSILALVASCKTDKPAGGGVAGSEDRGGPHRSGKIDLPRVRPSLPAAADDPPPPRAVEDARGARRDERRAMLDTNGDGEITPEEFASGQLARAQELHQRLDANGDGKVMIEELSDQRMPQRLEVDSLDTDHNNEISVEELRDSFVRRRASREERRLEREERGEGWGGAGWRRPGAGSGSGSGS